MYVTYSWQNRHNDSLEKTRYTVAFGQDYFCSCETVRIHVTLLVDVTFRASAHTAEPLTHFCAKTGPTFEKEQIKRGFKIIPDSVV